IAICRLLEPVNFSYARNVVHRDIGKPVRSENQANKPAGPEEANHSAGTQDNVDTENSKMEANPAQDYFVLPIYSSYTLTDKSSKAKNKGVKHTKDIRLKTNEEPVDQEDQAFLEELERLKRQEKEANDAAEVLRKEFAQSTEDLLLQVGAARAIICVKTHICTDIAKIIRKRSKSDKHRYKKGKRIQEPGERYQRST
ncbi:hypothetical protein Tco_1114925, partial [Tanacetum coccineum]